MHRRWYFINDHWRGSSMWPIWHVIRFACDDGWRDKLEHLFEPVGVSRSDWLHDNAEWYTAQVEGAMACRGLPQSEAASLQSALANLTDPSKP